MHRLLLLGLATLALAAPAAAAAPPYRLASVDAYLFFNDTGTLSKAIPPGAPLWNTVIGEGWAGQASDATLVKVTIAGAPGTYESGRYAHLTVEWGVEKKTGGFTWKKKLLDRRNQLSVLTRQGRTTAGFWVPDTGCNPLRLTARIDGQPAAKPVVKIIPFRCGE